MAKQTPQGNKERPFPKRDTAEAFPPGEYIQDELTERGWTYYKLVFELGMDRAEVLDLLAGRLRVTLEIARGLTKLFVGTSTETWTNLQAAYDRAKKG